MEGREWVGERFTAERRRIGYSAAYQSWLGSSTVNPRHCWSMCLKLISLLLLEGFLYLDQFLWTSAQKHIPRKKCAVCSHRAITGSLCVSVLAGLSFIVQIELAVCGFTPLIGTRECRQLGRWLILDNIMAVSVAICGQLCPKHQNLAGFLLALLLKVERKFQLNAF